MARSRPRPTNVVVRSYHVGFGDCFLLSFEYARNPRIGTRHVLIDFGTTALPPRNRGRKSLAEIAKAIKEETGGKLHAVVATHRHKDHIGGFQGSAGRIIAELAPKVVLQPWTEDPDAPRDATGPTSGARRRGRHVRALAAMEDVAGAALREVRQRNPRDLRNLDGDDLDALELLEPADADELARPNRAFARTVAKQLGFLGEDNISNKKAVKNLMEMGEKNVYAHYGSRSGLESVLPGVKTHVLGPPTLDQSDAIEDQRHRDPSEFWHFQARAGSRAADGKRLFAGAAVARPTRGQLPIETRWFLGRLDRIRGEQLLAVVRTLDEAMNNTSLILLFEVGRRKLLFSGDAQIENWEYCLKTAPDRQRVHRLLKKVDFYKVGHHGSLNATPKTLWNMFEKKGGADADPDQRLRTMNSTLKGKHGSVRRNSEVPRRKLTEALSQLSNYKTTEDIRRRDELCNKFEIKP